jgi:hypothetical protein
MATPRKPFSPGTKPSLVRSGTVGEGFSCTDNLFSLQANHAFGLPFDNLQAESSRFHGSNLDISIMAV